MYLHSYIQICLSFPINYDILVLLKLLYFNNGEKSDIYTRLFFAKENDLPSFRIYMHFYFSREKYWFDYEKLLNPLSANVGYIRHDTVVTSDSCNSGHSENYERCSQILWKRIKFATKWYTELCILVDTFLRNCVTKSNFWYFLKKSPKKGSGT